MADSPRSDDDAAEAFDRDSSADSGSQPTGETGEDTYHIPGGLAGWEPGLIPPPNSDGTPRKSGARKESVPAESLMPATAAVEPVRKVPALRSEKKPAVSRGRLPQQRTLELLGFNLLVFLSSVCVMTLELTASRLIAKHVGSSLYTWTSVIGVVLAGITLGNSLGGWLADRYPRAKTLAWMFLLSSIACSSVLWLDQLVGRMPRPEYISWPNWVLIVVGTIFLLPAVLLGTTSPLVASMALERSTRTGSTVGNVYAWGAAGSIVGTFLTGFYLIDTWGTRSIVGMTAAVLAVLAVIVASRQWVFRTGVVTGWLQLLGILWLASTITRPSSEAVAATVGWLGSGGQADSRSVHEWTDFGNRFGEKLHELGILLRLRDDQPKDYHDESSYSYIQVRDDYIDGSPVKALRLDKLDHSYFDPGEPTKLHYEYEQIYAAITRRAAPAAPQQLTATVPDFPGRAEILENLPEGVEFDAAQQQLRLPMASPELLDQLTRLSREADFWQAVEQLQRETTRPQWGGFSAVELPKLPPDVVLPDTMRYKVRHDPDLETLSAYEVLTPAEAEQLLALGQQVPWRNVVQSFRQQTAALSTLFIGGGGFIFPRWILTEFPASQRIDIAELDPAVYQAVRLHMGLNDADNARMNTFIGDARNFIDDRVRENRKLVAASQPPVLYDFIYGDAFNDFSVPWHLTTREFTQQVHDLLSPDGVFLANIIEIYPRTEVPGGTVSEAVAEVNSVFPEELFVPLKPREPTTVTTRTIRPEYGPLTIVGPSSLKFVGPMPTPLEERLLRLAPEDGDWLVAVSELAERSRSRRPLPIAIPDELLPSLVYELTWTPSPAPFSGVDVYRLSPNEHVLGLRGVVSNGLQQRLLELKPDDKTWQSLIHGGVQQSRQVTAGRFLGRYVHTMTAIFPYVAVFCTSDRHPSDGRDTFVVVCARKPINLKDLDNNLGWDMAPFAEAVRVSPDGPLQLKGQMESLLELAKGQILTDDFAPVDNLLRAVFVDQDR